MLSRITLIICIQLLIFQLIQCIVNDGWTVEEHLSLLQQPKKVLLWGPGQNDFSLSLLLNWMTIL